eukprot:3558328-Prymnesium_polylepis.1
MGMGRRGRADLLRGAARAKSAGALCCAQLGGPRADGGGGAVGEARGGAGGGRRREARRDVQQRLVAHRGVVEEAAPHGAHKRLDAGRDGELIEQPERAAVEVGAEVLHRGEQREHQTGQARRRARAQRHVVPLEELEQRRLDLVRRVPVEREDALRVEGEVAREPIGADAREDELDRLERRLVHARRQRRVQALVQPFGDEHLVGDDRQLAVLVEDALQLLQVMDEIRPLHRALEPHARRVALALEVTECAAIEVGVVVIIGRKVVAHRLERLAHGVLGTKLTAGHTDRHRCSAARLRGWRSYL